MNPHRKVGRIFLIQFFTGSCLALSLFSILLGNLASWPLFALTYGVTLTLEILFLSHVPNEFWPAGYRFRDKASLVATSFISFLIPYCIFWVIKYTTPSVPIQGCVAGCSVYYLLAFPFGVLFSFFAILFPMLGLQSFFSSVVYLVATRLVLTRSNVETKPLSSSFVVSVVKSSVELLGLMGLIITLAGGWLLRGDMITTLSFILALQSLLPLYLIAVASRKNLGRRLKWIWTLALLAGYLLLIVPDIIPIQMPSVVGLIFHSPDWRSTILASITATILWGMAVGKAYVISND
jgi:hypothetical protein